MAQVLVFVIPVLFAALVVVIFMAVSQSLSDTSGDEDFARRLREVNRSEFSSGAEEDNKNDNILTKWNKHWYTLTSRTGVVPPSAEAPGNFVLVAGLVAFGFGALVLQNVVVGLLISFITPVIWKTILNYRIAQRSKKMDRQLPDLIFHMRSKLQASSTPQQAIASVADEVPAPLGTELALLREDVDLGRTLSQSLQGLATRVPSREMQFLVSSIEIAAESGSDLDPQLKVIQDIIRQRSRLARHLATAVASVQPSIIIAGGMIPLAAAYSIFGNETNQAFWSSLWGMAAGAVVAVLYVVGLVMTRKLIRNIENL